MYAYKILPISALRPYDRNPRTHSPRQVEQLRASIREFGFTNPLLVDQDYVVIAGHGRLEAAIAEDMTDVPCIIVTGLTPAQRSALVIADNQLALNAGWDEKLLAEQLAGLKTEKFDLGLTGMDSDEIRRLLGNAGAPLDYTHRIEAPIYEPKGDRPRARDLYDTAKADELERAITAANLPADVEEFLSAAAQRHVVFNFQRIAEFYAQADEKTQRLMEDSALVLIDFGRAIENGYVKLSEEIAALVDREGSSDAS